MASADRRIPVCKVSVGGSPLETADQGRLVRCRVDLDPDMFTETELLFMDPKMEFINSNKFDSGTKIDLKLGFGASADDIFSGEVVRLEPQFRRDQPVALMVIAQEPLHKLGLKHNSRAFNDSDASDALNAIAQDNGLTAEAPSGTKVHMLQNNLTDAEFLKRMAHRMGMQLKMEDKKLSIAAPPPSSNAIPLTIADGIKKLKVKKKAHGQVQSVSVHGWDAKNKTDVVGNASAPGGDVGKGASTYGKGKKSDTSGDLLPPDVASAEEMAKGQMQKIAEGFAVLTAEMIGDVRLVPGAAIEFDKLGAGCDGKYRIERARHEFSKHGYFVKFDAVWTGPKDPPKDPPAKQPEPYKPPEAVAKGKLTRPRWKRQPNGDKDNAVMAVDATKPLEGKSVKFILESKATGEWKQVATGDGTISGGVATATSPLDPMPAKDVLSAPKWEAAKDSKHTHGESADVTVQCKLPDPTTVRIILEQQLVGGRAWDLVASKVVQTSGNQAKAQFDVAHPSGEEKDVPDNKMLASPTWTKKPDKSGRTDGVISVEGTGLPDGRKVRFTIQRLGADNKWSVLQTVDAEVKRGEASAAVKLVHPGALPQPDHSDQLQAPKWAKGDLSHGDMGKLSVDAPGLDGRKVKFIVERNDQGKWVEQGEAIATVKGGKAETSYPVSHPTTSDGTDDVDEPKYDPKTGVATLAVAASSGSVQFSVQRKGPKGWVDSGHFAAKIGKDGNATLQVFPVPKGAKISSPSWSDNDLTHGDKVSAQVKVAGAKDGTPVYFQVERNEGGDWVPVGTATGKVSGGAARAQITVAHPAKSLNNVTQEDLATRQLRFRASFVPFIEVKVSAQLLPDMAARKVRFRAEVVPDTEIRALRFSAKPVPDLRARKIRFRAELPVPEGPLSRLTVKLVGGTDDDTVSTAASAGGN